MFESSSAPPRNEDWKHLQKPHRGSRVNEWQPQKSIIALGKYLQVCFQKDTVIQMEKEYHSTTAQPSISKH